MTTGIGLTGVDHPAIAVQDVDKMADWYCAILGYKKHYRHDKPVWMLLAPDNTLLEIMPIDDTHVPRELPGHRAGRTWRYALKILKRPSLILMGTRLPGPVT